ncbi:MAG: TrmH family RNA methyltransferase [Candidatus Liptonbacteria bacterium]|nr:TrmH family RNA methyltransferase [Candidatus Liptonbacteria bacterium]MBI3114538.1 TrmH family RNA methyltransferase [Candidatus Harrisonbacteria bacterium]
MHIAVILHNIRSLHNVGSIFRTADGAGVEKIYLCGITPTPLDRFGNVRKEVAKVALGAERTVAWEKARSTVPLLKKLKREGWTVVAAEQAKGSVPYTEARRRVKGGKVAVVLGAEVRGVPPSVLKVADVVLEIPMRGAVVRQAHHPRHTGRGKESLNVSVAAGIVLFSLRHL